VASKLKLLKCKKIKIDCMHCSEDGRCRILNNTEFQNKDGTERLCPFYKPKEILSNEI